MAEETREGDVYRRLLEKLEEARQALGGQVSDVLGKLQFEGRPLRDLLIEAIRYGDQPEVRARLTRAIEHGVDRPHLQGLIEERALAHDAMDSSRVARVVEDFARYLYLPRLAGPEVLVQAIRDGVAPLTWQSDAFAYAESHDEDAGRYRGLRGGQVMALTAESTGLLVKPDLARRQIDADTSKSSSSAVAGSGMTGNGGSATTTPAGQAKPDRFRYQSRSATTAA